MWLFTGKEFKEEYIEKAVGFVYLITNKTNGRKYIGKKLFTKSKTYQKNKKKKRTRVSSDWMNYYGSNKELQEDVKNLGPENFERQILLLCNSKSELSYYESKFIFQTDALLDDKYYNSWISCRINSNTLRKTLTNE